jgi:hypothetical protein
MRPAQARWHRPDATAVAPSLARAQTPRRGGTVTLRTGDPPHFESWTQPTDTTYVFRLRRNARWHPKPPVTGREVTAETSSTASRTAGRFARRSRAAGQSARRRRGLVREVLQRLRSRVHDSRSLADGARRHLRPGDGRHHRPWQGPGLPTRPPCAEARRWRRWPLPRRASASPACCRRTSVRRRHYSRYLRSWCAGVR